MKTKLMNFASLLLFQMQYWGYVNNEQNDSQIEEHNYQNDQMWGDYTDTDLDNPSVPLFSEQSNSVIQQYEYIIQISNIGYNTKKQKLEQMLLQKQISYSKISQIKAFTNKITNRLQKFALIYFQDDQTCIDAMDKFNKEGKPIKISIKANMLNKRLQNNMNKQAHQILVHLQQKQSYGQLYQLFQQYGSILQIQKNKQNACITYEDPRVINNILQDKDRFNELMTIQTQYQKLLQENMELKEEIQNYKTNNNQPNNNYHQTNQYQTNQYQNNNITINVQVGLQTYKINTQQQSTIQNIKQQIGKQLGINSNSFQVYLLTGQLLQDNQTISHYKIKNNQKLQIQFK